eukprot:jgi/Psemu1/10931/gm1.10931_g
MSMTSSMSAQEEGRAFVEAAEELSNMALLQTRTGSINVAAKTYQNPGVPSIPAPSDLLQMLDTFQHLPDSCFGTNDNEKRVAQDLSAFAIQRKRERRMKLAMKATTKLFPSLAKVMVKRSNKLNKSHICLKWHLATKDATTPSANFDCGFTRLTTCLLSPKYKDDNHFKQDWFMGIYMQLMTNYCPEWADGEPTCVMNFASMEFPIFARDTEDMETSAASLDIQLAQSWKSPSTINVRELFRGSLP